MIPRHTASWTFDPEEPLIALTFKMDLLEAQFIFQMDKSQCSESETRILLVRYPTRSFKGYSIGKKQTIVENLYQNTNITEGYNDIKSHKALSPTRIWAAHDHQLSVQKIYYLKETTHFALFTDIPDMHVRYLRRTRSFSPFVPAVTDTNSKFGPITIKWDRWNSGAVARILSQTFFGLMVPNWHSAVGTGRCKRIVAVEWRSH